MSTSTRGVVWIHGCAAALCRHIEWAIGGALSARVDLQWDPQPVMARAMRAEVAWQGPAGTAALIASALRPFGAVWFEVSEDPSSSREGERYSFTPSLGMFRATVNAQGDICVTEDRIRAALAADEDPHEAIDMLLGGPWDAELEAFRFAGDDGVRLLQRVI